MAYSQPNSEAPQIAGSQIYRITQTSTPGGGDIWESKVGAFAFAVGPLSDYANYQLVYRDQQVPITAMAEASFTPGRPFIGEIFARNDPEGVYPASNRPGRILVAPADIFNDSPPSGFTANDVRWFEPPVIDILQYLRPPAGGIPTSRPDKHLRYQTIQAPTVMGGSFFLQIPAYGRRYASVLARNRSGQDGNVSLVGMTFTAETNDTSPIFLNLDTSAIANLATVSLVFDSNTNGMFDYLMVQFTPVDVGSDDVSLDIVLSDTI